MNLILKKWRYVNVDNCAYFEYRTRLLGGHDLTTNYKNNCIDKNIFLSRYTAY